jgi:enoyl-CoA hydratase/carnithine racemase
MSATAAAMTETAPYVLRNDANGVTTLTLNRPQQYNALSQAMLSALQHELDVINKDDSVRVVVLAADGKAFCAGHDLKEMRGNRNEAFCHTLFEQCSHVMLTLNRLPQPVIARVQGIATAAGCQLVAACDLAVAAEGAKFATSGINVGLFCSTPAVPISRNLARKHAMELLITGEFIDANTALQQGLINRVAKLEALDNSIRYFTDSILAKSAVAVSVGKRMFYKQLEMDMESAYHYASQVMANNMMSEDTAEGLNAFVEKRPPVWQGR